MFVLFIVFLYICWVVFSLVSILFSILVSFLLASLLSLVFVFLFNIGNYCCLCLTWSFTSFVSFLSSHLCCPYNWVSCHSSWSCAPFLSLLVLKSSSLSLSLALSLSLYCSFLLIKTFLLSLACFQIKPS